VEAGKAHQVLGKLYAFANPARTLIIDIKADSRSGRESEAFE
jgi:hypothetical protein